MKKSSTRICFIVNPAADRNRAIRHVDWINREANNRFKFAEIVIAPENHSVCDIARNKAENFEVIVACGGDGTVNQVVNGIAGTETKLGILPIGNGNDFARLLLEERSLTQCMDVISNGKTGNTDLISCHGDHEILCINTLGLGLDGLANYNAKQYKRLRGSVIYILGALKALFSFGGSRVKLSINGRKEEGNFLLITACNGQWEGGGFHLAPNANPSDGLMHLVTIEKMSVFSILWHLPLIWLGRTKNLKKIKIRPCKSVEARSEKALYAHCDGEHLGDRIEHLQLTVVHDALKVVIP